jgi:hypothetical protein
MKLSVCTDLRRPSGTINHSELIEWILWEGENHG